MAFWIPAAMAAGGFLKNELIDKPEHARQMKAQGEMAAAQTEHSPLTGMGAGTFKPTAAPSSVDAAMKWGMAGAQMGQGMPASEGLPKDASMSAMNYGTGTGAPAKGGFGGSPWTLGRSKTSYA